MLKKRKWDLGEKIKRGQEGKQMNDNNLFEFFYKFIILQNNIIFDILHKVFLRG